MKLPKFKVIPDKKEDKHKAKLMSKIINYEYRKNRSWFDKEVRKRLTMESFGYWWDK